MQVFESLNCILCKEPFARSVNQPRSPLRLGCGLVICHNCFEKEEVLRDEERKHHCIHDGCFHNSNFAYFLIDVLSQEDTLTLAPIERGYVLAEPLKIPECPMCDEEYSSTIGGKKSFLLHCNHTICTGCYLKARRPKPDNFKQKITCPTCMKSSFCKSENRKNQFQDFMNELPKMTRQLEATRNALGCEECHEKFIVDVMFYCSQCVSQICGACAYLKHRLHNANHLLRKRASDMMLEHWVDSSSAIKSCDKMLGQLNKQLSEEINSFGLKLLSKTFIYKNAPTFSNLYENHEELTKLRTDFEATVEEYLPHLHNFGTKVKELIQAVDKKPDDDPIV